jgi:hypothetical protein
MRLLQVSWLSVGLIFVVGNYCGAIGAVFIWRYSFKAFFLDLGDFRCAELPVNIDWFALAVADAAGFALGVEGLMEEAQPPIGGANHGNSGNSIFSVKAELLDFQCFCHT